MTTIQIFETKLSLSEKITAKVTLSSRTCGL